MNEPISQSNKPFEKDNVPEADNLKEVPIDLSPDKVLSKTLQQTLLFSDMPFNKVGSNYYPTGGVQLAIAAGNISEIQFNAGNGVFGADENFKFSSLVDSGLTYSTLFLGYVNITSNGGSIEIASGFGGAPSGGDIVLFAGSGGVDGNIIFRDGDEDSAIWNLDSLTDDRTFTLPDASGTIALTSDLGGFISSGDNVSDLVNDVGYITSAAILSDSISLTGKVADIADTVLNSNGSGLYRVSYYLFDTTADLTAGAVTLNIKYTDNATAKTLSSSPVILTATTGFTQGQFVVRLASGDVTYGVTHTGIFGTAVYALYLRLEFLG